MKNQEQTNEGSRRDPESIRKEYKELKKASISYLRTEWSRSFRVGDPKGTDKTGLISDILRARHGNKHVDAAFESEITEIRRSSVSGTMSGSVYSLEDRKYELKKDVKGARIGDFINVTLPKGTIIYNLPGGLFADHFSLKSRYTTPYGNGPKWLSQSWGQGVSIRQMPETLSSIEKNSKVLESAITEKREDVGKYNTVKKVIAKLGRRPSEQDLASFINKNYYDVTEVERGDNDPSADDKIADLVGFYKFDIDDWETAWEDAQNESAVIESGMSDIHMFANDAKNINDFIKMFFKEFGDKVKKTADTIDLAKELYTSMIDESAVTEEVVYNSSNTKPEAAKKATKEFGKLLPKANKGVEPYVFAVIKTKARNYRLAIKSGSYVAHEFMSGLKEDGILTADIVKKAVANVIKLNPEEFNESVVTEAKFKAGDKWQWKTKSDSKVVKIIRVESNGDIIAKEDGKSQKFIVRDADKYLTKIITEAAKIETERYVRSHGKKPRGYGGWMFSYNRDGSDEWQIPKGMEWPDAQKWAKKKAKEDGEDYVYVMESVVTEALASGSKIEKNLNKALKSNINMFGDNNETVKVLDTPVRIERSQYDKEMNGRSKNFGASIMYMYGSVTNEYHTSAVIGLISRTKGTAKVFLYSEETYGKFAKGASFKEYEGASVLAEFQNKTRDVVSHLSKFPADGSANESVVTEAKNSKEIKELEDLLKSIKSNTPADQGRKASIQDDIERLKNESVVTEAKNTIGLAFKEEQDYLDFKEFVAEQPRGAIRKNIGFDSKTKSWNVEMDVKVLDSIYGEGTPSDKESGWYGGLPDDFESVIIESVVTEKVQKIACLECDEVNTRKAWEKNKGFCPSCKDSSRGVTEANKGKVHKAAKQGSYPAVIVVVQDGKVIHQEPVSTPEIAPATFNVMQKKYPKALLHLEDNTGKRLFSESVVNEDSKDRMIKQIKRALKDGTSIFKLPMATQKYYNKNKGDFESVVTESVFTFKTDNIEQLHFETDPKTAELMKIELGKKQGEVSRRKQIESGEYSLRRFRKEIGYGNGKDVGVFLPGSYDASVSKLGDGPHKKAVKAVKWNQKKYDQWLEDMAANGGADNAFDMAQNAKNETGLIDWVKKEFRGDDPLQRIQWDIEAFAESVVTESKPFIITDFNAFIIESKIYSK